MSNLIPSPMTPGDLAALLRRIADLVEVGDCTEGHLTWDNQGVAVPGGELVSGVYRTADPIGGQGGVHIIGTVPPPPTPPTFTEPEVVHDPDCPTCKRDEAQGQRRDPQGVFMAVDGPEPDDLHPVTEQRHPRPEASDR